MDQQNTQVIENDINAYPDRWMKLFLSVLMATGFLSVTFYVPSMLAIAQEFGVAQSEVQFTLSTFLIGFAVGQILYGPLSDQFGRRPVLLIGLCIFSLASMFCALADTVETLQVARFFQGLFGCCGVVISRAVIRDLYHPDQAIRIFAFISTVLALSPAIAPILGGQIQVWLGWQAVFWLLTMIGGGLFVWVFFFLKETNEHPIAGAINPMRLIKIYGEVLAQPRFTIPVIIGGFMFSGIMSYATISPFLMMKELGVTPDFYGVLVMMTAICYGFGTFLSGKLSKKFSPELCVILGPTVSAAAGLVMISLTEELSIMRVIGPAMFFMFGAGLIFPPTMAMALGPFKRMAGSASAMMGTVHIGAAGITTSIILHLYDGTAIPLGLAMLGLAFASILSYCCLKYFFAQE